MSIKCMTRIWEKSKAKGSGLLLLLAIADHADDDGFAWPGIPTLAHKIRMSERQTIRIIKQQEVAKELIVVRRPNKSNLYVVTTDPSAKRLKAAAARVVSFSGYDILSLCKNVMSDMTSEATEDQKCHADGDIAMSPDPSLNTIEPSSNHQSDSTLSDDSPSETPEQRLERLREKFGADPLEAMAAANDQANNSRPKGWSRIDPAIFEICRMVGELFPCSLPVLKPSYPEGTKEIVRGNIDKWVGGAILILEKFNGNSRAAIDAIVTFRHEFDDRFIVAGPKSITSSLSVGGKKPKKKQERRGAGRPVGRWTEEEIEVARQESLAEPVLDPATFFDE